MRTALIASLLAFPLFTGCAAVALGAIGGLVISKDVSSSNVYETRLNTDVSKVWPMVQKVLSDASLETIEIDQAVRSASAKIDGSKVTVTCADGETPDGFRCDVDGNTRPDSQA